MNKNIPVVILCGGRGTRLDPHTRLIPKPLIKIGQEPILHHIMKIYAYYGFDNFIICLGHLGKRIQEHFKGHSNWKITLVDTGLETNTGGRIKQIKRYVKGKTFMATYGDGLADINLKALLDFHRSQKKIATLTAVRPLSPFGLMEMGRDNLVSSFAEKLTMDHWVNGGFFVFEKEIFEYIGANDILEREVFVRLVARKELVAFQHYGFWECMDTYKDAMELNDIWRSGQAPWAVWEK